jgi:hypothetical protein
MKKYKVDDTVFENIDNEEKAYWLGFILADGSIQIRKNTGQHLLKISLAIKDKEHLIKFKTFIKTQIPIKEYLVGNGLNDNKSKSCEIIIYNKKIVQDLIKLGIGPKKSFNVKIPTIKKSLLSHLIRGIWDGDGSVLFRARNSKYPDYYRPEVQICGNSFVLGKINDIFKDKLFLSKSKLSPIGNIFVFRKSSSSAQKIAKYLYKDSTIHLNRKYEKAIQCINWIAKR